MTQQQVANKNEARHQYALRCRSEQKKLAAAQRVAEQTGGQALLDYSSNARQFSAMWDAFYACEQNHVSWLTLQGKVPGESGDADQWLENLRDLCDSVSAPREDPAAELTVGALNAQVTVAALAADIQPRCERLANATADLDGVARHTMKALQAEAGELRTKVSETYLREATALVALLPAAQQATTATTTQTKIAAWLQTIATGSAAITAVLAASPEPAPRVQQQQVPQQQVPQAGAPPPGTGGARTKLLPKLETIKVNWDGRPATYYRFKRTFEEIVHPAADGVARYEYLMAGLPQNVKDDLLVYTSSPEEVWQQLDDQYGRPGVQLEAALSQLGAIAQDPSLTNDSRMKKLYIVLQSVATTLREQGQGTELTSDSFVRGFSAILPHHEVNEYAIRLSSGRLGGVTRYEKLVSYLKARSEEIREADEIRATRGATGIACHSSHSMQSGAPSSVPPGSSGCNPGAVGYAGGGAAEYTQHSQQVASGPGTAPQQGVHTATGLPAKAAGRHYPTGQRKEPFCINCQNKGHDFHRDGCDKPELKCNTCGRHGHATCDRDRRKRRGEGGGGGGRDAKVANNHTENVDTMEMRQSKCYRCKSTAEKGVNPCAGCGLTKRDHCLYHCEKFSIADVPGRVAMAKKGSHCPCCLALGHTWEECKSKENEKNRCGLGGCTKRHHMSLHSSSDPYVVRCNLTDAMPAAGSFSYAYMRLGSHNPLPVPSQQDIFAMETGVTEARKKELREMRDFSTSPAAPPPTVMMMMITAAVMYGAQALRSTVTMFLDTGSTCSIITHACAERLSLYGRPVTVWIKTVNAERKLETRLYWLEVVDKTGARQPVLCLGMDSITSPIVEVCLDGVRHKFPPAVQERWAELSARPTGEVDVLLGSDYAAFFPTHSVATVDHLIVSESPLTGQLLAWGTHADIAVPACEWNTDVLALRSIRLVNFTDTLHRAAPEAALQFSCGYDVHEVSHLSRRRTPCAATPSSPRLALSRPGEDTGSRPGTEGGGSQYGPDPCALAGAPVDPTAFDYSAYITEQQFLDSQDVGVEPPRRCTRCRGCTECSFRGLKVSEREEAELEIIQKNITFDPENKEFRVSFPWIKDPMLLTDNYSQAQTIARQWEAKYEKLGATELANSVFSGMIENGMVRRITATEIASWTGPVHYVSIQGVQSGSATTPLRLVTNTSLKGRNGLSTNDAMAKGPDLLGDSFAIFQRFRTYQRACLSDVSKCYHRLRTGLVEMHTRRVLWRFGPDQPWQTFGLCCVSFGDRCASAVLEAVLRLCAEMFGAMDPEAAWRLVHDRFVDDWHSGGTPDQVQRFVGEEDENWKCSGTVPQIFEAGGLVLKCVVQTGEPDGDKLAKLGNSVMGLGLSTARDELCVPFRFNFTKKKSRLPSGPDLSIETLDQQLGELTLTRRLVMGAVAGIFDPYGYVCPVTIAMRAAVRRLFTPDLDWDTAIPDAEAVYWKATISQLVLAQRLVLPRGVQPDCGGEVIILVFFDASQDACAAVVYLVWLNKSGNTVHLLVAKSKLAPGGMMSVPRLELIAALLASRLSLRVVTALAYLELKIANVMHVGDSETVLAALEKSSGFFSDFYSNRILEVRENMRELLKLAPVAPWQHVPGPLNPADRPSRLDTTIDEIGPGSEWLCGPSYLTQDPELWPFNRDFASRKSEPEFPAEELSKKLFGQVNSVTVLLSCLAIQPPPPHPDNWVLAAADTEVAAAADPEPADPIASQPCRVREHTKDGFLTNSWRRLLNITAGLFRFAANCRKASLMPAQSRVPGLVSHATAAVRFWLLQAMPATRAALKAGKLRALRTHDSDGMIMVSGRAGAGLKAAFQRDALPVLMSDTRVAYLIMLSAHEEHHSGRDITLHLATATAWIVGGRRLATSIKTSCVRCKYLEHRMEGQAMAPLPDLITVPCPPFTNIGIDYAGFFNVLTGGRNTRRNPKAATRKVWALIIACLNTKAVSIILVPGYDTASLVLALQEHVADRGAPAWVHSDKGSQMQRAAKDVNEDKEVPDWDFEAVSRGLGASHTKWTVCPAGAQWRNGSLEAVVKKMKKTLATNYGKQLLNIFEMRLAFKRIASLINSRPVYARSLPGPAPDTETLTAITPNHLLLGRATPDAVHRDWDLLAGPHARLSLVQDIEAAWWRQWATQCLPGLVPTPRWRTEQRAIVPGDIVLLQYGGKIQDTFRLARVILVEPGKDGLTRTVVARYSLTVQPKNAPGLPATDAKVSPKYLRCPVQRLCVILPAELQDPQPSISQSEVDRALAAAGPATQAPPEPSSQLRSPLPAPHPGLPATSNLSGETGREAGEDGPACPVPGGGGAIGGPAPRAPGGPGPDPGQDSRSRSTSRPASSSGKSKNCSARPNPRQPHLSRSPPRTRARARAAAHPTWTARLHESATYTSVLLRDRSLHEADVVATISNALAYRESLDNIQNGAWACSIVQK